MRDPAFTRETLSLSGNRVVNRRRFTGVRPSALREQPVSVLVINAGMELAREITIELSHKLTNCSLLFAPTLQSAVWTLKRRRIDLVVAATTLTDGPAAELYNELQRLSPAPELILMSDTSHSDNDIERYPGYRLAELRRLGMPAARQPNLQATIESLGADLRNDLNNPLQEIVALAFVAQASVGPSPIVDQTFAAIEQAAKNMAGVVNSLEGKLRVAVGL